MSLQGGTCEELSLAEETGTVGGKKIREHWDRRVGGCQNVSARGE